MKKVFSIYSKVINPLVFFLSCLIIISHLYFISNGFYFTGDTISYFVPAYPGRLGDFLSVFLWSYATWPPGMTFIFHTLRFLPFSIISQHQIYVILISLLSIFATYLISRRIIELKIWQIVIIALSLFTGVQAFLFTTALSEPLLIFTWLAAIFSLERFVSTQKERFLLLYILFGSLIPISRYLGIGVLLGLNIALLFYLFVSWKSKKYSISLVITSVIFTWIPIGIYFLRSYILSRNLTSGIRLLIDPNLRRFDYAFMSFIPNIFLDNWPLLIAGIILGTQFKWSRTIKYFLILFVFSIGSYYVGYAFSLTKFRAADVFHSRYISVAYPAIILCAVCVGSFLGSKILKFSNFFLISLTILIFILGNQLMLSVGRYKQEINSSQSIVQGVEYSADIRKLCLGNTINKYLFLQESSLNWIGQSLGFYCQPISIIPFDAEIFELPKDAYLFTPYKLAIPNLKPYIFYSGDQEMRVYKTLNKTTLNIKGELKRQIPLDWFSGAEFVNPQQGLEDGKATQEPKEWVSFESADLKFSTKIPNTWQTYSVPHRKAVFFISNIPRNSLASKTESYSISAQVITLEDKTLEELYFPKEFFGEDRSRLLRLEKHGDYLIYRTEFLNTQDNIFAVFITKDGKYFIRFSLAPFINKSPTNAQTRMIEYLNKIVEKTMIY